MSARRSPEQRRGVDFDPLIEIQSLVDAISVLSSDHFVRQLGWTRLLSSPRELHPVGSAAHARLLIPVQTRPPRSGTGGTLP